MKTTTKKPSKAKKTVKKTVKKSSKASSKVLKDKTVKKETIKEKTEIKEKIDKENKYFEAVGRRKTSTARVRLFTIGKKEITVNEKPYKDYFSVSYLQKTIESPFEKLNVKDKFGVSIRVKGGGISSQADACRHGISRALILVNPYFKKRLRKAGFLTRDPRMRERKKFGLKRARKAPQWSKR